MLTQEIDNPARQQLVLVAAPYLLGTSFSGILLGCLSLQLYTYVSSSNSDKRYTKFVVYTLCAIELAQTAITMYCAWLQLVWAQGPYESMSGFNWSVSLSQLLAGVVSCITQCCFARRIWILKTTPVMRKVVFCIVVFAVIQCASAVAYSALIHIENANAGPAAFAAPIIWLTGSFICDTLIAGSLLHILFEARSQTQMKTTATVLTKLIAVTIQTGFITAVVAGLQLISYLLRIILPFIAANDYWVMCSFLLGKLYANVLLATLNARTIPVHIVDNELNMGLEMTPRQGILFRAALPDINHPTAFGALVSAPEQYYGADGGPATTMKGYADV